MKLLSALILLGAVASANAQVATSRVTTNAANFTTAIVSTPVITSQLSYNCVKNPDSTEAGLSCVFATTLAPVASAVISASIALLKEEVEQVQPDAYNYLAGEDMSLALQELIQEIRKQGGEVLENSSDEEIIREIILKQL